MGNPDNRPICGSTHKSTKTIAEFHELGSELHPTYSQDQTPNDISLIAGNDLSRLKPILKHMTNRTIKSLKITRIGLLMSTMMNNKIEFKKNPMCVYL